MKNIVKGINRAFTNWKNYNETVRELNGLDRRALADLGISREDIRTIAKAPLLG